MLFSRDLSWLNFNDRILLEVKDASVPLYERLRFLSFFSSNLNEFFRVRYPEVAAFSKLNKKIIRKESFFTEEDFSDKIQFLINEQLNEFGRILINDLIPALNQKGICFYYNKPLLPDHAEEVKQIFLSRVLSFIQPVFLSAKSVYDFLPENNQPVFYCYFIKQP